MDWRFNTIWFEQLNQETLIERDYKEKSFENKNTDVKKIKYASIWHLNEKNNSLENLKEFENLLFLSLNSSNVRNMQFVENFKNLKRLELHYCVKLENDFGIINKDIYENSIAKIFKTKKSAIKYIENNYGKNIYKYVKNNSTEE